MAASPISSEPCGDVPPLSPPDSPLSLPLPSPLPPCSPPASPPDWLPSPPPLPTSAWAIQPVNDAAVDGRLIAITWPGARSTGEVGPSSVPFDRCTSTLTRVRVLFVVFSTVPVKALLAASKARISRAPARTASKVSSGARVAPLASSLPDAPDSPAPSVPPSPPSPPLPCSPPDSPPVSLPSCSALSCVAVAPESRPSPLPLSPLHPARIPAPTIATRTSPIRNLFIHTFLQFISRPFRELLRFVPRELPWLYSR